ncbi:hypothetical protein GQ53DRAFT_182221 [Thozetella sp. PMI_491]|nr:hypothetical protein GQ53DRAFT_182221 [Thozetella sp. PMI_491]
MLVTSGLPQGVHSLKGACFSKMWPRFPDAGMQDRLSSRLLGEICCRPTAHPVLASCPHTPCLVRSGRPPNTRWVLPAIACFTLGTSRPIVGVAAPRSHLARGQSLSSYQPSPREALPIWEGSGDFRQPSFSSAVSDTYITQQPTSRLVVVEAVLCWHGSSESCAHRRCQPRTAPFATGPFHATRCMHHLLSRA